MRRYDHRHLQTHRRRGALAPAALVALVVVIGAVGLTLESTWLETTKVELQTAAEAAALAGARELASDELLHEEPQLDAWLDRVRLRAGELAGQNLIGGDAVQLDTSRNGDVRIGRLILHEQTGRETFLETTSDPATVVVRARHSRDRRNPVVTFFQGLTGPDGADVEALAEATIDNRIVALRPIEAGPVPVLPIAVLHRLFRKPGHEHGDDSSADSEPDSAARRARQQVEQHCWQVQIEERQGQDRFSVDAATGEVFEEPDGLPEIVVCSNPVDGDNHAVNGHLIVSRRDALPTDVQRHITSGWSGADLPDGTDRLSVRDSGLRVETINNINSPYVELLQACVGQSRIIPLYEVDAPLNSGATPGTHTSQQPVDSVKISAFAAVRVMAFRLQSDGSCRMVLQPTVLTTRTAVTADEEPDELARSVPGHRYLYKLQLTQ